MKKILFAIFIITYANCSIAKDGQVLKPFADSINSLFQQLVIQTNDKQKEEINSQIISYVNRFIKIPVSFDFPLDTIKYLSCVVSPDDKLRIYTWNLYYSDGTFKYFGFIQQKEKGKIVIHKLDDLRNRNPLKNLKKDMEYYTTSEWYGCIYYECIVNNWNSKTYYTLIGWDGANSLINRKVIEVLTFTKRGIPVFEKKMFKVNRVVSNKLIFEYADRVAMLIRYNEKHNIIVLDHLSPSEDRFDKMYEFYGPDMIYDALEFKGGRWLHISNIDPEVAINYQKNQHINRLKKRNFTNNF